MARTNADLYGFTIQFLYFSQVAVVGGVTLDAAEKCLREIWDFDVALEAVPTAVEYEAA